MIAGPSGIGKTTIAKDMLLEEPKVIQNFMSLSVSDLIANTKDMKHKDMLSRSSEELLLEDYQILTGRKNLCKAFKEMETENPLKGITDRSFLDSAAYFWLKQVESIPHCELDSFIKLCSLSNSQYCDALILANFTEYTIKHWVIEDNNKRITSNYFQYHVCSIMRNILKMWGYVEDTCIDYVLSDKWYKVIKTQRNPVGIIKSPNGEVPVLILNTLNRKDRIKVVNRFLNMVLR